MSVFNIGDLVSFGRPKGEKTEGIVVRINKSSLTIEQKEARGKSSVREAGAKWRAHPSNVLFISRAAVQDSPVADESPAAVQDSPVADESPAFVAEVVPELSSQEMGA